MQLAPSYLNESATGPVVGNSTYEDETSTSYVRINKESLRHWVGYLTLWETTYYTLMTKVWSDAFETTSEEVTDATLWTLSALAESIAKHQASIEDFKEAVSKINWVNRSAVELYELGKLAIEIGRPEIARNIIADFEEKRAELPQLSRLWQTLEPPRLIASNVPAKPLLADAMTWLKENGAKYMGQWVAVLGNELLDTAPTRQELIDKLGTQANQESLLVTKVN